MYRVKVGFKGINFVLILPFLGWAGCFKKVVVNHTFTLSQDLGDLTDFLSLLFFIYVSGIASS